MMLFPYKETLFVVKCLVYFWETALESRYQDSLKHQFVSKPLKPVIKREDFRKYQTYRLHRSKINSVYRTLTTMIGLAMLSTGFLPMFWEISGSFLEYNDLNSDDETLHSIVFGASYFTLWQMIDWLYLGYVLTVTTCQKNRRGRIKGKERKRQFRGLFSVTSSIPYIDCEVDSRQINKNLLRSIYLHTICGLPVLALIIYGIQKGGWYSPLGLWGITFYISITKITMTPHRISYSQLPNPECNGRLRNLAKSVGLPVRYIHHYFTQGRYSDHCNVEVYFVGTRHAMTIVMPDTLIDEHDHDELEGALAHKLGHWKLNHELYSFIATQILVFLKFGAYIFLSNSKGVFKSFGFETQPTVIGLVIFEMVMVPVGSVGRFCLNIINRSLEFKADDYAKRLGYSVELQAFLIKETKLKLSHFKAYPSEEKSKDLFRSFGFVTQPLTIEHFLFQRSIVPLLHFLIFDVDNNPLGGSLPITDLQHWLQSHKNLLSPSFEFQHKEDVLGINIVDKTYSAYYCSHPHIAERLARLAGGDELLPKKSKRKLKNKG